MNFYQSVFLEKNFFQNIRKKVRFWGNYPVIFTLSDQSYCSKIYFFKNLDYKKSLELQKKSKTFF